MSRANNEFSFSLIMSLDHINISSTVKLNLKIRTVRVKAAHRMRIIRGINSDIMQWRILLQCVSSHLDEVNTLIVVLHALWVPL